MPNSFRRPVFAGTTLLVPALLLCLFTLPASQAFGQETAPPTAFQKQLAKFDLGLVAAGEARHYGLRHRAARREHHAYPPYHQAQLHRRRTRHPALHRQALGWLRVQRRQPPLYPGLHLRSPARADHPYRRGPGRSSRADPRLRCSSEVPPLRHHSLLRRGRWYRQVHSHPRRRPAPALSIPRCLLLSARPRRQLPQLALRHASRLSSTHLPRARLSPELPHYHSPNPHLRAHHRLLRPLLGVRTPFFCFAWPSRWSAWNSACDQREHQCEA